MGAVIGYEVGAMMAADPDIVVVVTVAATTCVGAVTEGFYALAKRWGWKT